jgi:acyl-CoA thioesterase-1
MNTMTIKTNNFLFLNRLFTVCVLALMILFSHACKPKQDTSTDVDEKSNNKDENTMVANGNSQKIDTKYILFFGNSLTAGYGLDEDQSFPALIQLRLDSLKLPYTVINGGLSGETTSGGKNRIEWVLKQKIDIFVLELGANDVLRGLDLSQTETNLRNILDKVKASNPNVKIVLAGMQAPPNMGNDYTKQFRSIYITLAKEYNASLIPFLLENVATIPALNLEDGKHPNAAGQYVVRENVWKVLKDVL